MSASLRRLAPLSEEPINEDNNKNRSSIFPNKGQTWRNWLKNNIHSIPLLFNKKSTDLKILLSVLGCPLSPVSSFPPKSLNNVATTAQYIIQHYTAATGCRKMERVVKSLYATGNVKIVMTTTSSSTEEPTSSSYPHGAAGHHGCFVVWQMVPDKWLMELVVSGHKVIAGSDGNVAWRHTPWLGAHAAKGGVRPLRRALQGLDPVTVAAVFSAAQFMGEKRIMNEDCFVLKLSADQSVLLDRSDPTAEIIKHVMIGYFSQRSGLLVYLEDSQLTRIQSPGTHPTYWETTMGSKIEDYRTVVVDDDDNNKIDDGSGGHCNGGVMISHSGHSSVSLSRFGNNVKVGPAVKRMEESWTMDDVAFNVAGLSMDAFIPPEEVRILESDHQKDLRRSSSLLHRYSPYQIDREGAEDSLTECASTTPSSV